ncbi:endonuclease/exonuclease/phosphatase family protein [Blastococcus sp. KM273129]|uniref:endonuclease/exonuclease/phosphatase family protein n=1 Tax=Blastococcus sp. KM273129 TaxID=2570315 RepID=UPI0035ABD0E8
MRATVRRRPSRCAAGGASLVVQSTESTVRIGTYNLRLCPTSSSARGQAIADWMKSQDVDVWLLTEVHRDWTPGDGRFVVAPERGIAPAEKRWSGVETRLPLGDLRTSGDPSHAGEEGLTLARLELDRASSVLVACSVLPWKGAGPYWPGLPSGQAAEFRHVLDHHVARISAERLEGEPLVWGGDFNQQLTPPYWFTTAEGAEALRAAFDELGLVPLTERAEHLNGTSHAIDHLAVSRDLLAGEQIASVHRPEYDGGHLSDHAAYTAEVGVHGGTSVSAASEPLYRTATGGRLHIRSCPHLSDSQVLEATVTDGEMCAWCDKELRGEGRRYFSSLADALPEFGAPRGNWPLITQHLAGVDHDQVWIVASGTYIALGRNGRAVAWSGKTYVNPSADELIELPDYRDVTGRSAAAVHDTWGELCPVHFIQRPRSGRCESCDD